MHIAAIDAGNTRIKWALRDDKGWRMRGILATSEIAAAGGSQGAAQRSPGHAEFLAVSAAWPADTRIILCNVAGAGVEKAILDTLPAGADIRLFASTAECCGVRNGYRQPGQLGADRWAALIGARGRCADACLVVCAGTATTVDVLGADGFFHGGLILPGLDLMRSSLARDTARLPMAEGSFRLLPDNTMDAIISGCLQAQMGAIERMFAGIASEPGARCILTGGAAPLLCVGLNLPFELVENLILDGLSLAAGVE